MDRDQVEFRAATAPIVRPVGVLVPTYTSDSMAWMWPDLLARLVPFTAVALVVWVVWQPRWLGLGPGQLDVQLAFGLLGGLAFFGASCLLQVLLTPRRGSLKVPGSSADMGLQAGYYFLNAPIEEIFFRGLLQGGLTALAGPVAGILAATSAYVLYHRLGGWAWIDVAATALVGVPVALAFWLLPGPPSLLGITLVHAGATCGFLGPGPWLLRKLGVIS
ncbi:MAG TPA: CPBP family intramembrane glutamic endopeptidase [Terriglobales bacterium]|nr:CPBP family intramembrane glutamic endopeptidase [Terriglobales bacterium]